MTGVGIVGAGVISRHYLRNMVQYPDIAVRGVADEHEARAQRVGSEFGIPVMTVTEVLAEPTIDIVLNSPFRAHTSTCPPGS
ncbi:Gfo/Idh/MocA family oxidoreductase [Microbacterium radiodurans]|uniref:Gfo/Idh/MocA-like oxidoreductase N-terminal domain-containing protein n=1 Tax=Microbacterium radiodurans TaxID=661398 RepID=A0A5J5IVL2_9MICO|nr:hypothetical protein F6B42_01335 [Microbacterium radiodurans]